MAQSNQRSKAPLVSVDPNKHVVEEGFPLYLSKNKNRYVQYFPEEQVVQRTNDFRPTPVVRSKQLKAITTKIFASAPELANLSKQDLKTIMADDLAATRTFEQLDPLKGNGIAVADYLNASELCAFGAGPSLSNLVILVSEKKQFNTVDYPVDLPLNSIEVRETINLRYPVRQISMSPLSTAHEVIFAVRTTSTIHLFTYDHRRNLRQLHRLHLAEATAADPRIDYAMPIHVEMSPYSKYEYVYTANNGYTSVMDAANNKVIFSALDPVPETANYISRWRSCAYGKTPFTILLASPECIKEWNYSNDMIQTNTLAISNDRIVAFKTSHKAELYCFATIESVVIMDSKQLDSPVVEWLHGLKDGLPSTLFLESLSNHNWRIIAFSNESQRATMMEFQYTRNTHKSMAPTVRVLGLHQMPLSIYHFDDLLDTKDSRIRSMGIAFNLRASQHKEDTTKGYAMFSALRVFEDGSVKVHYLALLPTKPDTIDSGHFQKKPRLVIDSSHQRFDKLQRDAKLAVLPSEKGVHVGEAELFAIKMTNFKSYVEERVQCAATALTEQFKTDVSSRVRQLAAPTTFRALFDDETFQEYDLEDLTDFLLEMEMHEDIERGRQITIPGVLRHCKPADQELNQKLKEAHEKETQLCKIIIHPLPHQDDPHTFQYLGRQPNIKFASTTTTKVLSSCWSIDDSRFDNLPFPIYDTSSAPQPEVFPSVNIYKRRRSSGTLVPEFSNNDLETETATIPAIVKSTPHIPTIKKTKAASLPKITKEAPSMAFSTQTQTYGSTQMLSPHRPTSTQSSSQRLSVPQSPTSTFANVSTQPVEGAFASRKKAVQKKKKKTKSSGFK
ncbi:hypothetical protein MAM1_0026d02152 [Mucor ambiguus]|uniref:Uncharacterized protein n=1 Tax=Mucor ambiguus TaxID=91626 RepID=A0A0C9M242_9FUNG|nr:hypothetical protein MAM1_0026d02152 [Mucor ambiguus]